MALSLFERLFGGKEKSGAVAKDRLKLVLMHDRTDIPAPMMEAMRRDLLAVLSKYVDIDETDLDVQLEKADGSVMLVTNIPIRRVRTEKDDDHKN
jgi:cell division topological specificity factor